MCLFVTCIGFHSTFEMSVWMQAKLICSYNPQKNIYALPEGNPIINGAGDVWGPQQRMGLNTDSNLPTEMESNSYVRDSIMETMVGCKPTDHKPVVYTLPKNTSLEQPQKLDSFVDVGRMQVKFAKDICSLMGVPFDMLSGGCSEMNVGEKHKSSAGGNKVFATNMMTVCRHIELLLADVYLATYGGSIDDIEFSISPMARFEINSVQDICQLMESGLVSAENAADLSNMVTGLDMKQSVGKQANAGQFSKAFMTPKNRIGMMSATASVEATHAKKKQLQVEK